MLPALCLLLTGATTARAGKPNGPVLSVALADLGYGSLPARYAMVGETLFTVHFVDEHHLLVTFAKRSLLKRLPDAEPEDQDRAVEAVLLELPTGQVIARTTWRVRDHAQYLWSLGHGRFLLRVRNRLTLLDPLAHLPKEGPQLLPASAENKTGGLRPEIFTEENFVELHRQFGHIVVSPGGDLLAIETLNESKKKRGAAAALGAAAGNQAAGSRAAGAGIDPTAAADDSDPDLAESTAPRVQINFFRLLTEPGKNGGPERLVAQSAGVVAAPHLIEIPATGEGWLRVGKESSSVFLFDYVNHDGTVAVKELSPFDTTCVPRPYFISRSEFIAFGCAGRDDKQQMAGFNMRGEETWISAFSNRQLFPFIIPAPAAGRFALSRTISSATYLDLENLTPDQISSQEVTVYQNHDGRQLMRLETSPFQRAGQNFDISADGMQVAVVRNERVEVYALPALTRKDLGALEAAAHDAPARNEARVTLGAVAIETGRQGATSARNATAPAGAAGGEPAGDEAETGGKTNASAIAATPAPAAPAADPSGEANGPVNGDEPKHRTPPSLYDADHPKPALPQ